MKIGDKVRIVNPASEYEQLTGVIYGQSIVKDAFVVALDNESCNLLLTFSEDEMEILPDLSVKVVVKGGVVIGSYANVPNTSVKVLDLDNYDEDKEIDAWISDELDGFFELKK